MTSQPIDPLSQDLDERLAGTLVLLYKLSTEALEQINALMKELRIRFAEAAVKSGAVTQEQLDEAMQWVHQRALAEGSEIVEEALRNRASRGSLLLWERDRLEPSAQITLIHDPDHPHSEKVRSLRTELLLRCRNRHRGSVIALLSSDHHEGRSHLAAELAITFAQLGRRTLLVDADLRRPSQHRLFGAANLLGLAQVLGSGGPHCFHGIAGLPDMALMTSGALPSNPLELLSGAQFERTLRQWRRKFEFVILDTPPTNQFSDSTVIAAAAGNVLILGRSRVTRFDQLNEVCRKLSATNARVLGAVINDF